MIRNKAELKFYIMADYMMNRGYFKPSITRRLINIISPDYIMRFLTTMRKLDYHLTRGNNKLAIFFYRLRYNKLSLKLGFSIGPQVFGYGLVIPHYGTIVVGETNRCGNYCVLHTSTCISGNGKVIGDALYLATGAKMTTNLSLGNNVMIGANSLVNKSFPGGVMIAGAPAREINRRDAWYIEENSVHKTRVASIEELKFKFI